MPSLEILNKSNFMPDPDRHQPQRPYAQGRVCAKQKQSQTVAPGGKNSIGPHPHQLPSPAAEVQLQRLCLPLLPTTPYTRCTLRTQSLPMYSRISSSTCTYWNTDLVHLSHQQTMSAWLSHVSPITPLGCCVGCAVGGCGAGAAAGPANSCGRWGRLQGRRGGRSK